VSQVRYAHKYDIAKEETLGISDPVGATSTKDHRHALQKPRKHIRRGSSTTQ